jgi:hypothetical protein
MSRTRLAIVGAAMALVVPLHTASAAAAAPTPETLPMLAADWWQWALSIPAAQNPERDPTGKYCMVGQRGPYWFLAGVFGGGTATRSCAVPENKTIFLPVVNEVNFNTPNVCGQDAGELTVTILRATSKTDIDSVTSVKVQVDGKNAANLMRRVRSQVFEIALPEQNLFDKPCADAKLGNVPAGIYSPAVDDGYYVTIPPLKRGRHTVHFRAERGASVEDVIYHLTVEPVLTK